MARRRIVVIGLGSFGRQLVVSLDRKGQDVLAIDRRRDRVDLVRPHCARAEVADVSSRDELEDAGVSEAEAAVVSLGAAMDASILATMFLRELGVEELIVKANSPEHGRILERVGATEVVFPEREIAVQLAQRFCRPGIVYEIPFLEGHALVELRAPPVLWGRTLADSDLRGRHNLFVVRIMRLVGGQEQWVRAEPQERVREQDLLLVLARLEDVDAYLQQLGRGR